MSPRGILVLALALAACGSAELEGGAPADAGVDGPGRPIDAPVDAPIDAPIDARACAGGDARATDQGGNCFVYFVGPRTWNDAQAACVTFGAQLAIIKSAQANQVVTSLIGVSDAFIGATDRVTEGTFLWRDATSVAMYVNWRADEPNNGGVDSTYEEDCAVIEGEVGGTWDDRPCEPPPVGAGAYAYVCQY
jgi:hypothetical protein